jgi:hypothetical protein
MFIYKLGYAILDLECGSIINIKNKPRSREKARETAQSLTIGLPIQLNYILQFLINNYFT